MELGESGKVMPVPKIARPITVLSISSRCKLRDGGQGQRIRPTLNLKTTTFTVLKLVRSVTTGDRARVALPADNFLATREPTPGTTHLL